MKICIKKTNLIVALLATTLFSTVTTAAVPKSVLIKAEPINQTSLINTAHASLKLSLTPIKVSFTQQAASEMAKQKQVAKKNKSVTLVNTNLIAE